MGGKETSLEEIKKIEKLCNETDLDNIEIANIFDRSDSFVGRVRRGEHYLQEDKPRKTKSGQDSSLSSIIEKLLATTTNSDGVNCYIYDRSMIAADLEHIHEVIHSFFQTS